MQKNKHYKRKIRKNEVVDPRTFTFRMGEAMAKAYLKDRTAAERKMDVGDYLCDVVNNKMGGYYKGTCVKVIVV